MARNRKISALVAAAMLAMAAVVASAAQANPKFVPEVPNVQVIGSQIGVHKFDFGTRQLACKIVEFNGILSAPSETLTITPEYKECTTTPVLGNVYHGTVTMNVVTSYSTVRQREAKKQGPPHSRWT